MNLVLVFLFLSIITYPLPDIRIGGQPLAIFLVIIVIIYGILTRKYYHTDGITVFALWVFLVSFLITGIIEVDSSNFFEYVTNVIAFYMLFFCFSMLSQNSNKTETLLYSNRLMKLVILTGIVLAIYGYYGYFTGNVGTQTSLFWWEDAKYWGIHYTESTRNSDVHYIAFPFCVMLSKVNKKWYDNLLLLLFASCLVLSMSRGCWISLIVLLVFNHFVLEKKEKHRITRIMYIVIAAIGTYLLLDYVGMLEYFSGKIISIFSLSNDSVSNSNSERLLIIKATLEIFAAHPFGVGANNLYYYYEQYGLYVNHAENSYLNIMAELGLAAMISYVIIIAKPLYIGIKCRKYENDNQYVRFICLSSLYLLCTSIFNIGLMNCHLWMMIAVIWYIMQHCRKEKKRAYNTN